MPEVEELIARAEAWIAIDPDPGTRNELTAMVDRARDSGDTAELADHVGLRLDFGTAGLRGEMGPGPNRLNLLMAKQTAAGLAATLTEHVGDASARGVLLGHDARHHSGEFARAVAAVLQHAGIPALLVEGPVPTPLVAWGVRHLGAAAGVVVTASHNPAKDNGIKIYWADGAQIVPPVDGWIAEQIDRVAGIDPPGDDDAPRPAPASLVDDYISMVAGLVGDATTARSEVRLASTAMHGVGDVLLGRCLRAAGFTNHATVPSQADPDPDFPSVPFPNPEEPGATDRLLELAASTGADLALANDPDADRLAAGIPVGDGWRMFSGDELGAVFAAGLMKRRAADPQNGRTPLLVTTVVSSQLLARIAEDARTEFAETLTGFKWLCRPAFADPSLDQVLAYEESIGYAVGGLCDKDGISAAVVLADLVADWKANGVTPQDVLDELTVRFGAHVQRNFSMRVSGAGWEQRLAATAAAVVSDPPTEITGVTVDRLDQPADDVIRLFLVNGDRVVIRPSGTEPKLKCYCEAVEPVAANESPDAARARANTRLDALAAALHERLAL